MVKMPCEGVVVVEAGGEDVVIGCGCMDTWVVKVVVDIAGA
jgi:hypothetical protein